MVSILSCSDKEWNDMEWKASGPDRRRTGKAGMDGTYVVNSTDKTTLDIFLGGGGCTYLKYDLIRMFSCIMR